MGMNKKGSGCLPRGTQISTPFGLQDISNLNTGDTVYAVNPSTDKIVIRTILKVISYTNRRILSVSLNDGTQIQATSTHSFQINNKWKTTAQLNVGDQIRHYDDANVSSLKTITNIQLTNAPEDVFNIIVDGDFNFLANGALSHSFTYLRSARMSAWRMYSFFQRFKSNSESIPAI